jgi:protein TonB
MMFANTAQYSPYGAFELKAHYQRNLLLGNLFVITLIGLIMTTFWMAGLLRSEKLLVDPAKPRVVDVRITIPQPISIIRQTNPGQPHPPKQGAVGIPKAIEDSLATDLDTVTLATRDQLVTQFGVGADSIFGGTIEIPVDTDPFDEPPETLEFVEIMPKPLQLAQPEYPEIARRCGMSGVAWVEALIDRDGNVIKARIAKSSSYPVLDDVALTAAFKGKFSPGIQNGRTVVCWVTYRVDFSLNETR